MCSRVLRAGSNVGDLTKYSAPNVRAMKNVIKINRYIKKVCHENCMLARSAK